MWIVTLNKLLYNNNHIDIFNNFNNMKIFDFFSKFSEVLTVTMQPVSPGPCKPPRLQGGRPKATFLNVCWGENKDLFVYKS